ncbi:MAG: hypothetical protein J6R49_01610 [Clostridia bacterium]|nr:hypothetical protein [Clostridia bacterium]
MKKRYALIIPHILGLATVLLFVAMGFSGTGNMLTDFIALGAAIFYTIYFLPFSSAVSAVWLAAQVIAKKEEFCKKLFIASGIIGAFNSVIFLITALTVIEEYYDLGFFFTEVWRIAEPLYPISVFLTPILWILWIIIFVKSRKTFSKKYAKHTEE